MGISTLLQICKPVAKAHAHRPLRLTATAIAVATCFTGNLALANPTAPAVVDSTANFAIAGNTHLLNSSLDLYAGYTDVDSGMFGNLFGDNGKGTIIGGNWNYYLPKLWGVERRVYLGLDYHAFQNNVTLGGIRLVPNITVQPISVGIAGLKRMTASEWEFNASVATNILGGNDGKAADFRRTRFYATDSHTILRLGTSIAHAFRNDWQSRIALHGKYTEHSLIPSEQFGIGSYDTVRGYLPREAANDRGYTTQFEVYTPNFAERAGLGDKWRTRMVGFYDFGAVSRNNTLPGEQAGKYLASAGLGLRLSYGKSVSLRLDLAQILRAHGTHQTDDQRLNATVTINY